YAASLRLNVPQQGPVWRSLGYARFHLKQYDQAVTALTEAMKYEPGNSELWFGRGVAQEERGEVDLAQADYAKAVEMGHAQAQQRPAVAARYGPGPNRTQEEDKN